MYEFRLYNHKKRNKNRMCTQNNKKSVSTKTELLKVRIDKDLKDKIKELSECKNLTVSEMTRELWKDYFEKQWKQEVANW